MKLDVDNAAEWQALTKYPFESGGSLPILIIFRADGEQLYARSGAPEQTAFFLAEHLKKSGSQLGSQQLAHLRGSQEADGTALNLSAQVYANYMPAAF